MVKTIDIMGGLGNQLFQIFTLISYALKEKTQFFFEDKPIACGIRKKYYWDTPLLAELKRFIWPAIDDNQVLHYHEPAFHYIPIPSAEMLHQPLRLNGYFQSAKYFQEHKEFIFRMIKLKEVQEQIRKKVAPLLTTGVGFDSMVSMHFRVGDYAGQEQNHPLMPVEYYEKALEQLLVDTVDKQKRCILYFCEENDLLYVNEKINYLKKNEKFKELTFMKVPGELEDWEQMLLMSVCRHHIIANSTFSWWGAYLHQGLEDEEEKGHVYYPSKWFGPAMGKNNLDDLFLKDWKKIIV